MEKSSKHEKWQFQDKPLSPYLEFSIWYEDKYPFV